MKRFGKFAAFAILALLAAVFTFGSGVGCNDLAGSIEKGKQSVQLVLDQGQVELTDLQKQADALPPGPDKDKVLKQIAAVQDKLDKAKKFVVEADATLEGLKNGQIPDDAKKAIGELPYGTYILLGLSLVGNAVATGKVAKWKDAATKIIDSWQVGPDLSPEHKAEVAEIQGPKVIAIVDDVKAKLAAKAEAEANAV